MIADRFDAPVGTVAERELVYDWPAGWVDATGFNVVYGATGVPSRHTGTDENLNSPYWNADAHSPVYSVANGTVVYASVTSPWGDANGIVVIRHEMPDGSFVWSRYAHVEDICVVKGMEVPRGRQIAKIGNAGGKYPYHLHFDISVADLGAKPGDWPGMDEARLLRDYRDPRKFIKEYRLMAPPVATIIRPPYGRTYHVCVGGTMAQRKLVYDLAASLGHSATCSADDGALDLLQMTPNGVTEFSSRTIYFYGVTDQAAYRNFVTGAYPGTVPAVIEFRPWPGEVKPVITFSANPTSIVSGGFSTLMWSGSNIMGAYRSDDGSTWRGVPCPSSESVKPTATKTYYFRVQDKDTTYRQFTATVTVTPGTTPAPTTAIKHGCHVRTDAAAARDAFVRGCRCIQIMDHFDVARELATNYPGAIIMHRKWAGLQNYPLNGTQIAGLMEGCGGKVWLTLLNEQDQYAYGTPAELRTRAQVEIDAARILLARGERVLLGGFSMGTPNWLDPEICRAFRETYAAFLNADTTGRVGLNFHLYSPYTGHMQGTVRRSLPVVSVTNPADGVYIEHIPAKTKNGDSYIITRLASDWTSVRALDLGDDRIWYEGRWKFAYDPAYGGVKPSIPTFSDEWGIDEGGVGGGPAHGWTQTDWFNWCTACTNYQKQPILVNGVSYPSPVMGGTVFQCSPASGWEGYYVPASTFTPVWSTQ